MAPGKQRQPANRTPTGKRKIKGSEPATITDKSGRKKVLVPEFYEEAGGNVSEACRALRISRDTFYEWRKRVPGLAQVLAAIDEGLIDEAESCLMNQVRSGNTVATIFFLCNKGARRGWQTVQKIEHVGTGTPIVFKVGLALEAPAKQGESLPGGETKKLPASEVPAVVVEGEAPKARPPSSKADLPPDGMVSI